MTADDDDDGGDERQDDIDDKTLLKEENDAQKVLTVRMSFYLEWCSLCLAGINCSLIRCRWDLWEEGLFSLCQVLSHSSFSV